MTADLGLIPAAVKVTLFATLIVTITGTLTAWMMHRYRFPGQNLVETVIRLPLALPPTVLLLLPGKNAHFTWRAAVTAAAVAALPLMYRSARVALAGVAKSLEQAARTMGATEWRVFFSITFPLARTGFLTGILLAFTRALGESGLILFAFKSGDMRTAGYLAVIIAFVSIIITYGLNTWSAGQKPVYRPQRGDNYAGGGYQKNLT